MRFLLQPDLLAVLRQSQQVIHFELSAFASVWQIPTTQSDTADTIVAKIAEIDWLSELSSGNLDNDEQVLLNSLGLLSANDAANGGDGAEDGGGVNDDIPTLGQRAGAEFDDGEVYYGSITAVNPKARTVTIKFDDGDEDTFGFDDIVADPDAAGGTTEDDAENDQEVLIELIAFCQAQQIDVSEDDTVTTLSDKVSKYEWHRDKLTPSEVEMLENLEGVTIAWAQPKPAKKAAGGFCSHFEKPAMYLSSGMPIR